MPQYVYAIPILLILALIVAIRLYRVWRQEQEHQDFKNDLKWWQKTCSRYEKRRNFWRCYAGQEPLPENETGDLIIALRNTMKQITVPKGYMADAKRQALYNQIDRVLKSEVKKSLGMYFTWRDLDEIDQQTDISISSYDKRHSPEVTDLNRDFCADIVQYEREGLESILQKLIDPTPPIRLLRVAEAPIDGTLVQAAEAPDSTTLLRPAGNNLVEETVLLRSSTKS